MLLRALRETRDGLLGLSYPAACRVCGDPIESWDLGAACRACWANPAITQIITGTVCFKCGVPTRAVLTANPSSASNSKVTNVESKAWTCGRCNPLPFSAARACGTYSGALEANILFLKSQPHLCRRLASFINETFLRHRSALEADLLVPVPLHRARERARGFNQAEVIGRAISRGFDLPLDDGSLVRTRATERHRAGIDSIDRAQSVEGAFKVCRPRLVEGASILIVDDVLTTGSTIGAVTKTLMEAGARRVAVFTVARVAGELFSIGQR